MKKVILLSFLCAVFFSNINAQTTNCNADFSWTISGNTVKLYPVAGVDTTSDASYKLQYWNFGDNTANFLNAYTTYHTFPPEGGTFSVTNTIYRADANFNFFCNDSVTKVITIQPACVVPNFIYQADVANYLKINFTNTSLLYNANDSIAWMFGDGSTSGDINASHTYTHAGVYHVCLLIKKRNTTAICIKEKCFDVVVTRPCDLQADFNWQKDPAIFNKVYFANATVNLSTADSITWDFGDGTYSHSFNPDHVYANAGKYTVCFTEKRNDNIPVTGICAATICKVVEIVVPDCTSLVPDFTSAANATLSTRITFTNTTTALLATDSVSWSFGDGTYSKDVSPIHTYTYSGTYVVVMEVKRMNSAGQILCTKNITKEIHVTEPCIFTPNFNFKSDSAIGNPFKFYFENTTTTLANSTDSVRWSFGDGTYSNDNERTETHTYANAGTYSVCLIIIKRDNNGQLTSCIKYTCKPIVITIPAPQCDFTAAYTSIASTTNKKLISFTATSTLPSGTDATVSWFFGDGSTTPVTGWTATHEYALPGKYYVCVRIQIGTNCVKYKCDSITVLDNVFPCDNYTIDFTDTANAANEKLIKFTSSDILIPSGINPTITWTFGDGLSNTMGGPIVEHEYAKPGRYYVCERIQFTPNCAKYKCDSITVSDNPAPCDFIAGYAYTAASNYHKVINFTATSSIPAGTTSEVTWFFGDNTPAGSGWSIAHTYAQPGKYYVCAKIQYSNTCYQYKCDSITVYDDLIPCDFTPGYTYASDTTNKKRINFTNTTTLIPTNANAVGSWIFGDGSPEVAGWNATHEYAKPGKYYVCLVVKYSTTACIKYKCDSITIYDNPVPCDFTAGYTSTANSANHKLINFTATSNLPAGTVAEVNWSFGDNGTGAGWTATHEYAQSGRYNVCVRIQYSATCVKYKCDSITVYDNPVPCDFTPAYTYAADAINTQRIDFTNTTILPTPNAIVKWTFGDGTDASTWNAVHDYVHPGKYYVCLRVQYGTSTTCVKYKCDSIVVIAPPITDCKNFSLYTYAPTSVSNLYAFTPVNQSSDIQYTWTFGDGMGSHDMISTHPFAAIGSYQVCLTAFKNTNCASTTCKEIRVTAPVNCDTIKVAYQFYHDQYMANKIHFYAYSNASIQQQVWTIFKQGSTTTALTLTQNNPIHDFADTGYYYVCLKVTTIGGCVKEYCSLIHIESISQLCELQTYPNPASSQISLYVQENSSEVIHAYVYDALNVLVGEKNQAGVAGNNFVALNVASLPAGAYTVKIIYGNQVCFAKFQKI